MQREVSRCASKGTMLHGAKCHTETERDIHTLTACVADSGCVHDGHVQCGVLVMTAQDADIWHHQPTKDTTRHSGCN